jgi:glucokinase
MPTVEELLQWHKESRMSEINAAPTMDAAFRLFAEVYGLDQTDAKLRFAWEIGGCYIACRAIAAMKKRVKASKFADEMANEMIANMHARIRDAPGSSSGPH